jgi:spore coat protein A
MNTQMTRRSMLKVLLAGGAALYIPWRFGPALVRAQAGAGGLAPGDIPKFRTPLLIPPAMPRAGVIANVRGKPIDYYEISMGQFGQQVLPAGLPSTTVWGYGPVTSGSKRGLLLHNAPSLTIEAMWNRPVRVKWINDLVDADAGTSGTCSRSTRPCTGQIRPGELRAATDDRRSTPPPAHTRARSRSSPMSTAP